MGMAAACARLVLGMAALLPLRAGSRPVTEADMLDLVAILRAELGCTRPIEIRESARITSPATIGWRHPLVLLPADWRSWNEVERRVVLAHEVAHVHRRDFAGWLIAQLGVALHFYNPLVHWLASRLRLEQEMAADGCAAVLAGGREPYLTTLAQMALRFDNRAVSWGARPFLPARDTFLRRIQMLRDVKNLRQLPLASVGRAVLFGTLATVVLLVAGLRGPLGDGLVLAKAAPDDDQPAKATEQAAADFAFVPADAIALVVLRPADLNHQKGMNDLLKVIDQATHCGKWLGLPVQDIEEIKLVMVDFEPAVPSPIELFDRVVFRSRQAHDWMKFIKRDGFDPAEEDFGGKKFYKPVNPPTGAPNRCYYVVDDRTLVVATESQVKALIGADQPAARPAWGDTWQRSASGQLGLMVDTEKARQVVGARLKDNAPVGGNTTALMGMIAPLWEQSRRAFLGIRLDGGLTVEGMAECPSDEAAEKVQQTGQALLTFAANGLAELRKQLVQQPNQEPAETRLLLGMVEDLVKKAKLERKDTAVHLRTQVAKGPALTALPPAIVKVREAARRTVSQNNLKQIGLAMHNYNDANGHFPTAAIRGPDGKTLHSWRIELLPYLEQDQLYKMYKLDEPWDSPNNRKVLARMPQVFRVPTDEVDTNTSYFVFTGKDTPLGGSKGHRVQDFAHSLSNTILAVEAIRKVPWTKPDDIDYDPSQPIPKLGGYFEQGFNTLFADGSVRFMSQKVNEPALRTFIKLSAD
jgi:hypothetical protein